MQASTPVKRRRRRRRAILDRLEELKDKTSIERVRTMNKEFGPYWYFLLEYDAKIPDDLKHSDRFVDWYNSNARSQRSRSRNSHVL